MKELKNYDLIVIGGGPGGYTAALYGARAGLRTVVLEKLSAGGQLALTHQVDNYPGFADGVDGYDLAENMQKQALRFGAEAVSAEVFSADLRAEPKILVTSDGEYRGKTVIIATGADPRRLGLEGEERLQGRGVHYCAACDGYFYRDKVVAVVGGGNSAVADALVLSRLAKRVIFIHRRDELRATKVYHETLEQAENVELRLNREVTAILENGRLTGLRLRNNITGEAEELSCDGVFISVGRQPVTDFLQGQLALEDGYLSAGEDTKTEIPGVFAVGDVRRKPVRQVVTAVADGAVAVHMAEEYLAQQRK